MKALHVISLRWHFLVTKPGSAGKVFDFSSKGPQCEPHWQHFVVSLSQVFILIAKYCPQA